MPSYDSINLTSYSESSPRTMRVDTLQVHHATTTSLAACRALMDAGGRQVSANYAMGNDGHLMLVVPVERRAFTSASSYDNRSITVEVCNTTLGPSWGISHASHVRLARLAVEMWQEGLLGAINRSYIIGHNEVPGSYATACPGPSMNLNLVVELAKAMLTPAPIGDDMKYIFTREGGFQYALVDLSLPNGALVTTDIEVAKDFSRVCPTLNQELTRAEFTATVAAAKKFAPLISRVDVDEQAIVDGLKGAIGGVSEKELAAAVAAIKAAIPTSFRAS